jgi:hypothetical protein
MPAAPRPTSADREPWYKIVTPRKEVREGRSFNPDEFAVALECLKAEQERGPDFLRLANALSALYPKGARRSVYETRCS